MLASPFSSCAGVDQWRIEPTVPPPVEGSAAFALGAGGEHRFEVGDYIEVYQELTAVGDRARLRPRVVGPALQPLGASWRMSVTIGARTIDVDIDRETDFTDLAMLWPGTGLVACRLTLVGLAGDRKWAQPPTLQVDALTFEATSALVLANRYPEPGHLGVARSTSIALEVSHPSSAISLPDTRVYVNGVLAFDAGNPQAGFDGAGAGDTTFDTGKTLRIVLVPTTLFDSLEPVTVRVVSRTASAIQLDETYDFTCEDATVAGFAGAIARDDSTIRILWDEAVLQVSPTGTSDALNPANWHIAAVAGFPAVPLEVVEVRSVSDREVDLVVDIPMTPRAQYEVEAINVADSAGNALSGLWSDPGYWEDDDEVEEEWG